MMAMRAVWDFWLLAQIQRRISSNCVPCLESTHLEGGLRCTFKSLKIILELSHPSFPPSLTPLVRALSTEAPRISSAQNKAMLLGRPHYGWGTPEITTNKGMMSDDDKFLKGKK